MSGDEHADGPADIRTLPPFLAVGLFDTLLILFAADTQRRLEASLQALERDKLSALFAQPEGPFLDLLKRMVDLLQKRLFSPAQTEREGLQVFRRGQVHLVRQIVGFECHVLAQGTLCVSQNVLLPSEKDVAKLLQVLLLETGPFHGSPCFRIAL